MQISGYSELFQSQASQESERVRRERAQGTAETSLRLTKDTVTFSEEALRLAAEMREKAQQETKEHSLFDQDQKAAKQSENVLAATAKSTEILDVEEATQGQGAPGSSENQSEEIQEKIEKLMQKLSSIMTSTMPEEQKQATSSAISQQIQELTAQLQELQAAAAKKGK